MRPHRHQLLPDEDLEPTHPVHDVPFDSQAESMRQLREAQNGAALGYRERDDLMTAWALSNTLSRQDMALATGLAKSRVDQIIRETYDLERSNSARGCADRVARHMP
jgi:hypothetical protein